MNEKKCAPQWLVASFAALLVSIVALAAVPRDMGDWLAYHTLFVGAVVALTMALNNYGVWTLVFAPVAIFWTRAIALMIGTRFWVWPSFNFKGAGSIFTFGTTMLVSHGFWIIQSQCDIFIAGRHFF